MRNAIFEQSNVQMLENFYKLSGDAEGLLSEACFNVEPNMVNQTLRLVDSPAALLDLTRPDWFNALRMLHVSQIRDSPSAQPTKVMDETAADPAIEVFDTEELWEIRDKRDQTAHEIATAIVNVSRDPVTLIRRNEYSALVAGINAGHTRTVELYMDMLCEWDICLNQDSIVKMMNKVDSVINNSVLFLLKARFPSLLVTKWNYPYTPSPVPDASITVRQSADGSVRLFTSESPSIRSGYWRYIDAIVHYTNSDLLRRTMPIGPVLIEGLRSVGRYR